MKYSLTLLTAALLTLPVFSEAEPKKKDPRMDKLWGKSVAKFRDKNSPRGKNFDEGNYAMFIHWGLYSNVANLYKGKTYYGIAEWIKHDRRAGIPDAEYRKLAETFNPSEFNAAEVVKLAKDAGMKYICITTKHHDGFAMYDSEASDFNIVDATPYGKDPIKMLSEECKKQGIGLAFYYSHSQDWTHPGGRNGPDVDAEGKEVTFDDYFRDICLPQVKEITSNYGELELIWFDTPGEITEEQVNELIAVVRENQPNALVNGRAGHGLGDYRTLGDMEVPHQNVEGIWESVDTTNDSWAYAWYDQHWKTPKEILKRLIACVGRGGTYMLNIGPTGTGAVPERSKRTLEAAGEWIKSYPQVVYNGEPSPWKRELAWGDAVVNEGKIYLTVLDWPTSGKLYLPGLKNTVTTAKLLNRENTPVDLTFQKEGTNIILDVPLASPDKIIPVIELTVEGTPEADPTLALNPGGKTRLLSEFAVAEGTVNQKKKRWMEKFGEWISNMEFTQWGEDGKAVFEVDVIKPGDYNASLTYAGEGRLVWGVEVIGGEKIQNEQNSSHNYQEFPMGWLNFPKAGKYKIAVSLKEGEAKSASLKALHLEPVMLTE